MHSEWLSCVFAVESFPVFGWPDIQQTLKWGGGGEELSKVYTQPRLGTPCKPPRVCITVLNSPNILVFISGYANTEKVFLPFA